MAVQDVNGDSAVTPGNILSGSSALPFLSWLCIYRWSISSSFFVSVNFSFRFAVLVFFAFAVFPAFVLRNRRLLSVLCEMDVERDCRCATAYTGGCANRFRPYLYERLPGVVDKTTAVQFAGPSYQSIPAWKRTYVQHATMASRGTFAGPCFSLSGRPATFRLPAGALFRPLARQAYRNRKHPPPDRARNPPPGIVTSVVSNFSSILLMSCLRVMPVPSRSN